MAEKYHVLGGGRRRAIKQPDADELQSKRRRRPPIVYERSQCTVCNHPDRLKIEFQLANGGCSYRGLASEFGLGFKAIERHHKKHCSPSRMLQLRLKNPLENNEVLQDLSAKTGISAVENLRAVHAGVISRWINALETKSDQYFIALTAQARANIELLAKVGKELAPSQTTVQINNNIAPFDRPEYVDAIATIVAALRPYPEARRAVAEALRKRELPSLDGWIRRRLRCVAWVQCKTRGQRYRELRRLNVPERSASAAIFSPKGPWRLSFSEALHWAPPNEWQH